MFDGFEVIGVVLGVGFLVVCIVVWVFAFRTPAILMFGTAMFFGGIANSFAFQVLNRLATAGYKVSYWRTPKDLQLYSEYWRIAPEKQWSRVPIIASIASFVIAAILLFGILYADALFR